MSSLWREVTYGARVLSRAPVFAAVVVLTLGLGIGANTAMFSIVDAVLLRPLPYPDADRLAVVWESRTDEGPNRMFAAPPNYADWRRESRSFRELGAFTPEEFFLMQEAGTLRVRGAEVSASLFRALGVVPALGRGFRPEEDRPGAEPVAIVGHDLWRNELGGDPDAVGREIRLDGEVHRVVGVMPEGFDFPPAIDLAGGSSARDTEVWVPLAMDPAAASRGAHFLTVVGRLAEGATLERAGSELRSLAAALAREYPDSNEGWTARVEPLDEVLVGDARTALLVLLGAVGVLLLIACVNVANLMLARAAARREEYAVRTALGAGRWALVRQALVESQLLALAGGAVGVLLAFATLRGLVAIAPPDVPRLETAGIDPGVLGYTLAISLLTGVLFGLVPALRPVAGSVADVLREGGRSRGAGGGSGLRRALVVAEVALSLALLVGGGLLFRSFLTLRGVDTGLVAERLVTMRVTLPETSYPEPERVAATVRELERRVAALPRVTAAGFTRDVPLATDFQGTVLQFEEIPAPPDERWLSHFTVVTPGYFEAMGIPLASGRTFRDADGGEAPGVAVVNEAIVEAYLDGRDPLGHRLEFDRPRTVVGVVGDVRLEQLDADPTPAFYIPHAQVEGYRSLSLVARYRGEAVPAIRAIRDEIRAVDRALPVVDVRRMEQILDERLTQPRFAALMLGAFSLLALVLSSVGLYGLMSYLVGRRTREIGLRIALGATPGEARGLVVRQGARLLATGLAIGLVAAFAVSRWVESLLFETPPADPAVFAGTTLALGLVGLLASWIPARRAAGIQPMSALRCE